MDSLKISTKLNFLFNEKLVKQRYVLILKISIKAFACNFVLKNNFKI